MSATTEYTCEVCEKPLEYSGRGRPPKRCAEHKGVKTTNANNGEETMQTRARPRPRPGQKADQAESEKNPQAQLPSPGKADVQSRAKAESAHKRAESQVQTVDAEAWPRSSSGRPMAKVTMTASELVPTGQYANVSVGPAQITAFIDLDRASENDGYFTEIERQTIVGALNELAEVVERDVIAVQRAIVLESMQEQLSS